ncbi:PAS domain-containing protein [Loktanella sp. S4079]|uniref:PAS domain-containing protein n=1 Tax=Loktanella sp. S4079 TaxID=579483 RepID=UPI00194E7AE6|nr:PAS domain-containing protein [Loktanella sp. S4079]
MSRHLQSKRRLQQVLIGLVFGILVISLGINAYIMPPRNVPLDANAGPLIFAGYLGGPIGGVITGLIAAWYATINSGQIPILGIYINLAIPAVGVLVQYIVPPQSWPRIPLKAIIYLVCIFPFLFSVPIIVAGSQIPVGNGYLIAGKMASILAAVGIASILLTWQILKYAERFASEASRSAELSKRLDLTLQNSGMGVFERFVGKTNVYFDAGLIETYGLDMSAGLVPAAIWEDLIHPEDLPRLQSDIKKADTGVTDRSTLDFRVIRPDGQTRFVRSSWVAEYDADGKPLRIIGVQSDLTDIRQEELNHLNTQKRLALMAENLPGVVIQSDLTDRDTPLLTFISPKCQTIWGYTDQEFYADNWLLFNAHDPEDLDDFIALLFGALDTGEPIAHRYQTTTRDGETRWLDFHGSATHIEGRDLIEAIVLDVTSEVHIQEQAEKEREIAYRAQKSESIGQLTGGVAHDFNNLLAVVLGNLELLADENDPETRQELLDAAISATMRGADLTKNLLAFARKARLTPEVLDLNNVVREAKNWMGRTLPESVSVETSLLAGLWPILADRSSLESALLNLILNARDAMALRGNLTIETANVRIDEAYIDQRQEELTPGRYVMLAVSDTGEGISAENLATVFEPFFTTKPPGSGSGLGLAMIAGFMKQSGGSVQVYSEVGEGTTFKLYFPVTGEAKKLADRAIAEGVKTGATASRILLAEDEEAVRDTLVIMLERAGYDVTAAQTGDRALEIFEDDQSFDLLLTDIVMPGKLQGTHLSKALRKLRSDLPVVFMSGYASEATVHGNGLRPEDIRLMKPVQRADLLSAVAQALATAEAG